MDDMFFCEECDAPIVDAPAHATKWNDAPALQCIVCCAIYQAGELVSWSGLDELTREADELDAAYYAEMEGL